MSENYLGCEGLVGAKIYVSNDLGSFFYCTAKELKPHVSFCTYTGHSSSNLCSLLHAILIVTL